MGEKGGGGEKRGFHACGLSRVARAIEMGANGSRVMAYRLRDRVVFITGASSGIGRACAVAFHRAGARVAGVARSADKLRALAEELGEDRLIVCQADVTIAEERARALDAVRARFGAVDVLVNNSGWASFGPVATLPADHLERMWALNVGAPVALIQALLPEMLARGGGQIINISSVVGTQPIPRMTMYSATKAALSALTTGLRMELVGTGVDVLLVAPGSTDTEFFTSAASVNVKAVRLGQAQYSPERVARAVVRSSRRRRREVTLTPAGWLITVVRRFSHRVADALIYRTAQYAMPESRAREDSSS